MSEADHSPVNLIVLSMGYAEDSNASRMFFVNNWPDDHPQHSGMAALESLALSFLTKYLDDNTPSYTRPCCEVFMNTRMEEGDRRCPVCGVPLIRGSFDYEGFTRFVAEHAVATFGNGYGTPLDEYGAWNEGCPLEEILSIPREEVLELDVYAERCVAMALCPEMFDDPDYVHHEQREAFGTSYEEFWDSPPWVEGSPESREQFARLLDGPRYRVGGSA